MDSDSLLLTLTQNDGEQRVVAVGERQVETLADLVEAAPDLKKPENLVMYCRAVNYLSRGNEYRLIDDPDAYRAAYEKQFQAEDPKAPFQEGAPRLHDFGRCQAEEIETPRVADGSVIFYVKDDFLGIPYRVAAPAPDRAEGEVVYEPVAMSSLTE
jgi:hypothetical protein